ncbi:MAG: alpha/beta hydrolase [Deltaproteobacteria bacterium]|nr:alpha/beta hydrolase [Deltaproteobacteria bacterium]MBW2446289.1 alpha/beta hydrolase [Deltaproteobacteria bacterium]
MAKPRSERFTTAELGKAHLHAMHWGERGQPVVVLAHGGGANAHWWAHVAPDLATSFHVVAFDFRGHGDSDSAETIQPGDFENDLVALLDHLEAPEAALVGHSMGGEVVLRVAASGRAAPRGAVLLDVARGGSARGHRLLRRALTFRHAYKTREEAVDRFRFVPKAAHVEEALRHAIASQSVHRDPDGRWSFKADPAWIDGMPAGPMVEADVTCPVLFLRGAESGLCSDEAAKELVAALPHGKLTTLPRAGHHVHIDAPEAAGREIRRFLHGL